MLASLVVVVVVGIPWTFPTEVGGGGDGWKGGVSQFVAVHGRVGFHRVNIYSNERRSPVIERTSSTIVRK